MTRISSTPNHWLCLRFGHLGDVLLTTGVLDYFGKTAGFSFDILTKKNWAPVFERHPHVKTVHTLPEGGTPQLIAFMRKLSREYSGLQQKTGLLDLHGNLRSTVLRQFWNSGPICTYPKYSLERRLFMLSGTCGNTLRATSVPQRYALALQPTGLVNTAPPEALLRPKIWLSDEEIALAAATLTPVAGRSGDTRPVALHPYAAHPEKTWPREQWHHLASLLEQAGIAWIVIGMGEDIFPQSPSSFVNRCTLPQSAALLSRCRALVTGDSGPMHLASAVNTPVVALFGPTTREWGFFPCGEHDRVLELPLACRPCSLHGNKTCPHRGQCLTDISPEQVMEGVLSEKMV